MILPFQTHHGDNLMVLVATTIEVFYAFGTLFIACELGQRINLVFDECNEMVDQFDWYLFPDDIQRMLPMILNFTQQTFELKCFGSAACNREMFKYVSGSDPIVRLRNQSKLIINSIEFYFVFF